MIMDVVINVSTTSLSDTGTAGGTLGYAVRFHNNVSHLFIDNIFRFSLFFNV